MPTGELRDLDSRLAFALLLLVGVLLLKRWYESQHRIQLGRPVAMALAILPFLASVYVVFEIFRSTRVTVAPDDQVIVSRFGAPVRGPISGPSTFRIAPFGIDQLHRFPKRIEAQRLACEGFSEPRTATIVIRDPMVFWQRGATLQRLSSLVCLAWNREARSGTESANEMTVYQLNLAVRDLGLEIRRLD